MKTLREFLCAMHHRHSRPRRIARGACRADLSREHLPPCTRMQLHLFLPIVIARRRQGLASAHEDFTSQLWPKSARVSIRTRKRLCVLALCACGPRRWTVRPYGLVAPPVVRAQTVSPLWTRSLAARKKTSSPSLWLRASGAHRVPRDAASSVPKAALAHIRNVKPSSRSRPPAL